MICRKGNILSYNTISQLKETFFWETITALIFHRTSIFVAQFVFIHNKMFVYDEIFVFNVIKTCFLFCAGNFEYKMWLLVESNIVALLFNHFLD